LVCILYALEPCGTYKPWHDKKTHKTYLKPEDGKCLHYYFYFIDEELGLCSARLPDLVPLSAAVLWQRAQLPGPTDGQAQDRVSGSGQRLWLDRGRRPGGEIRRW